MNQNKYKYLDKLYIRETKDPNKWDWFREDYDNWLNYWDYTISLDTKYRNWWVDWLYDPRRLRDDKIDTILSEESMGNLSERLPKSLFR